VLSEERNNWVEEEMGVSERDLHEGEDGGLEGLLGGGRGCCSW